MVCASVVRIALLFLSPVIKIFELCGIEDHQDQFVNDAFGTIVKLLILLLVLLPIQKLEHSIRERLSFFIVNGYQTHSTRYQSVEKVNHVGISLKIKNHHIL